MFLQSSHVLGQVAASQQTAVHHGVQGLDAAVQHLGELGDFGHFGHGQAHACQQLGGATGGQQLHAKSVQGLRKFDDTGLVRDGDQSFHGRQFKVWIKTSCKCRYIKRLQLWIR
jgi:hypothetical protein